MRFLKIHHLLERHQEHFSLEPVFLLEPVVKDSNNNNNNVGKTRVKVSPLNGAVVILSVGSCPCLMLRAVPRWKTGQDSWWG